MTQVLLSSTYFGPVQWYQKLHRYELCRIEQYDHYVKQTYRNRCVIASANGPLSLTIPIERPEGASASRLLMKDIRISEHGNWRHVHWQALVSAYGESPFFEYYADDLRPFFERRWEFLFDFNLEITLLLCSLLDVRTHIALTEQYQQPEEITSLPSSHNIIEVGGYASASSASSFPHLSFSADGVLCKDFRDTIIPKNPPIDPTFEPKPYYQVYQHKFGFQPNLSILDLLFNEGNAAICCL